MDKTRKTKAGRYGTEVAFVSGQQLDAGITASATVKMVIASPYRKAYIERASVNAEVLPIGSLAITATLYKKRAGAAAVALTAAIDLKVATQTALVSGVMALLSTLTDADRLMLEGDTLYADLTAAGTVTTQPVGLHITVELAVLE